MDDFGEPLPERSGFTCVGISKDGLAAISSWSGDMFIVNPQNLDQHKRSCVDDHLISSAWAGDIALFGSTSGCIYTSDGRSIQAHESGVSSIVDFRSPFRFYTTSWDGTLRMWDLRDKSQVHSTQLSQKILSACAVNRHSVVCFGSHGKTFIFDDRRPEQTEVRVSSLQCQIRCSAPAHRSWACGSIDGRIAVEFLGDKGAQAQRFAFSGHRKVIEDKIVVYPINSLSFKPDSPILASGGSDGCICLWDTKQKQKMAEISNTSNVPVASLGFTPDGEYLVVCYADIGDEPNKEPSPEKLMVYQTSTLLGERAEPSEL